MILSCKFDGPLYRNCSTFTAVKNFKLSVANIHLLVVNKKSKMQVFPQPRSNINHCRCCTLDRRRSSLNTSPVSSTLPMGVVNELFWLSCPALPSGTRRTGRWGASTGTSVCSFRASPGPARRRPPRKSCNTSRRRAHTRRTWDGWRTACCSPTLSWRSVLSTRQCGHPYHPVVPTSH